MTILSCHHLCMTYGQHVAVDHVSFVIDAGDYLAIIGGNGSGKSTLMKGLLQLKEPLCGEINYHGVEAKDRGYLPQTMEVAKDFPASVEEVVLSGTLGQMGHKLFYGKREKAMAKEAMEELQITHLKNVSYRDLSGGQQQRVLLARALCGDKKILFLDEPITGLDPKMTEEFYHMIRHLNVDHGITIVHISHDVKRVLEDANKILQMDVTAQFFGEKDEWINWQQQSWEERRDEFINYF